MKHKTAVGAATVYGVGAVWTWWRLGAYGVLSRPVLAVMAVGWPGIAAGVAVTYGYHVVKGER